jgi:mRNA-degrading endonuclease RelE of RelBE toxin-antitoxin system
MSFYVRLDKKIGTYILSLPRSHQVKVGELIDHLGSSPYPSKTKFISISTTNFDIKKCKGHQTRFRVRFGEYRLIYEIDESEQKVLILKLDKRGNVY